MILQNFKKPTKVSFKTMKIISSAFDQQQPIPDKYTCRGAGINPPLEFSEVPSNAKSLVLFLEDPDAPNGTFVHWVLYNIDPTVFQITENSTLGTQGLTTVGKPGYVPPCPPSGVHRYVFKLYALDMLLDIEAGVDKKQIETVMKGHIITQAELIGLVSK